ncbi:MAG: 2-dehydropantoate 2-reductase [Candidatus Promineifilaceae bacterium]|nr:2-dehydropantoate 2-reductase [Candidatus Promineifilaceae bacterium]
MNILIFGAGAVGGYLGAKLIQAGHKVTLIARGAAAEAMAINGLTVIEGAEQIVTQPKTVESLRQAMTDGAQYDQILVCMKAYDAQAALDELVAFSSSTPRVMTFQNGVGIEELFVAEFGAENVIAASLTTPLSNETYHSIVVERLGRGLALAPTEANGSISEWVDLFNDADIRTIGLDNYHSMKWSKMLVNMIGNATSAILNRHPRVVYSYRPTFKIEMDMLSETLTVMRKQKIKTVDLPGVTTGRLAFAVRWLPNGLVKPILSRLVAAGRGNKMPSFHIDLMSGREQNEVVFHNGAVVEAGRRLEISTPVNEALTDILLKLARGELDYQIFNGQPERLVTEVNAYRRAAAGN